MTLQQIIEVLHRHPELLRKHGITGVYIFGSVARAEARPDSDVDMFVDFEPDRRVGLFELMQVRDELSELLGCTIDLTTRNGLKPGVRETVLREAVRAA